MIRNWETLVREAWGKEWGARPWVYEFSNGRRFYEGPESGPYGYDFGTVAFSAESYTVAENAGSVTITVRRTESEGAITVGYATSDLTAVAGSDYTATSGTLSWADGETGDKTFAVTIADSALTESSETFRVTITVVSANGPSLGSQTTATVTITKVPIYTVHLYTGNGESSRSISTPDLSLGGAVIVKSREVADDPVALISTNGSTIRRYKTSTSAAWASAASTFSSAGFQYSDSSLNVDTRLYLAYAFRKVPRLLDVVEYTGNGAVRNIAHSLGVAPGMIIVRADSATAMQAWMKGAGNDKRAILTGTSAHATDANAWNNTAPTATQFTLGTSTSTNSNGVSYVAFLFAHDPDGKAFAGRYTGDGNSSQDVTIGWQPEIVWIKAASTLGWASFDTTRDPGFTGNDLRGWLGQVTTEIAVATDDIGLTATGFSGKGASAFNANTVAYDFIAFRS